MSGDRMQRILDLMYPSPVGLEEESWNAALEAVLTIVGTEDRPDPSPHIHTYRCGPADQGGNRPCDW